MYEVRYEIVLDYKLDKMLKLKIYIDVSVAEIFFDDGKISLSRCFKEIKENAVLDIRGIENPKKLDIYTLKNLYR